jgi:hypothetical protein
MTEPNYKELYLKTKKQLDNAIKREYAFNEIENKFFEVLSSYQDNNYYKDLWDKMYDIICATYIREECDEEQMEYELDTIDYSDFLEKK